MEKETMEKLGFTEDLSWETEEQEKMFLYDKIQKFKSTARSHAAPPMPNGQAMNFVPKPPAQDPDAK